jgi:hypothetical protein
VKNKKCAPIYTVFYTRKWVKCTDRFCLVLITQDLNMTDETMIRSVILRAPALLGRDFGSKRTISARNSLWGHSESERVAAQEETTQTNGKMRMKKEAEEEALISQRTDSALKAVRLEGRERETFEQRFSDRGGAPETVISVTVAVAIADKLQFFFDMGLNRDDICKMVRGMQVQAEQMDSKTHTQKPS